MWVNLITGAGGDDDDEDGDGDDAQDNGDAAKTWAVVLFRPSPRSNASSHASHRFEESEERLEARSQVHMALAATVPMASSNVARVESCKPAG
ncbi:hypothetical protein ColTof4_14408 [Colletotrichum tofieldiae]|nr:hypothetical protein ColTof3_14872 [Colletotrichum tofieldiae]GKT81985.1 hypothetical protein ColTof4_14408 [Colletotrichum tofieldiae]